MSVGAPAAGAPLLEVRGLTVASEQTGATLLHDLDFMLAPGETLGLVGESGAGKSLIALSLMRLLHGVRQIGGSVHFEGRSLATLSERELRQIRGSAIAMIFQEPSMALDPLMTIGTQVGEVLLAHSACTRAAVRERTLKLLLGVGFVDAERIVASYPHQLSGGQLQRCLIVLGTALKPRLLLADEPTSALDVGLQAEVLGLIRELQREMGAAMIFISHDMALVAQLADRIIVLREGRIVEQGPTAQLVAEPGQAYSRLLLEGARAPC